MRKFLTALASVTAAATLVAGCHSSSDRGGPLPDAAPLVKEASVTTAGLKSAHLALSVTGKIENLPVKTLEGDLTNQPTTAAEGSATITMGDDIDTKFVVIDGTLYATLFGETFENLGPAEKIYDVAAILNPDKGLANVLSTFTDAKAEGRQTINGQSTVKITGEVPADAVNKLAPQLKATAPMPSTVWIQEDGDHNLVQAQLAPSAGNTIQMTLSNWNKPVTIEKPAGV